MARIFRHHVSPVKLALAVTDIALITGSAFLAEWLRWNALDLQLVQTPTSMIGKLSIPLVTFPLLLGFGSYQSDAMGDLRIFFFRIVAAMSVSVLLLAALAYLLPAIPLWRSILLMSFAIAGAAVLTSHTVFVFFAADSFLGKRVIILGASNDALALKEEAESTPDAALKIIDMIALPDGESSQADASILEDMSQLPAYAAAKGCDLIVIGDKFENQSLPVQALIACKLAGVQIMDRLAFFEEVRGYVNLESVKADWIVFAEGFKGGNVLERALKRIMDLAISSIFLVLTSPILLFCAMAIKVTSKGPVFYQQERVGLNGETFNVLKLRSMRVDAEKYGKPQFAEENDPRITPVGNFLRRTRMDEIPQVINVLKGDMSFVGPRPERPYFVDQLAGKVPFYRERHCLKPGITGWAQIRYPYGASFEDSRRKLEYDLYYVKNYSLFLDLLIVLQTIRVVLFPHGVR